ncbi:unnamed protein product [Microthlaspi erraticum]|uniref:Reverse transcriptase zinc-binding domain-containing protein n=1 Tax=Microthlaspi erraticum TaxID=1685480 RepID=A0A6D2KLF1_9BRAS|nr:unnamed protein product [Microthlaspi erraticum]
MGFPYRGSKKNEISSKMDQLDPPMRLISHIFIPHQQPGSWTGHSTERNKIGGSAFSLHLHLVWCSIVRLMQKSSGTRKASWDSCGYKQPHNESSSLCKPGSWTVLSGLCRRAQGQGKLPGIRVATNSPIMNHLLFADDTMFFCKSSSNNCKTLKRILQEYEQASGQMINVDKSSITFSPKTSQLARNQAKQILGITKKGGQGKYLGLPEHFGRKKKDLFALTVDMIRQRAINWSSRFLSSAGKMTMLKSVLSSIPTYTMQCFKFPVGLCKRIQSALTSWRVYSNPSCLLARVLIGKYCQDKPFLEVSSHQAASHGWKGILIGRNLVLENLGKAIGDGKTTNIWHDAWLSTVTPQRPTGPATEQSAKWMVADLFLPDTNHWDTERVRLVFPELADTILSIRPSLSGCKDKYISLPSKSGAYTTKTGYHTAYKNSYKPRDTQSMEPAIDWIADIWSRKTSPKLQVFLWKLANGALALGSNLSSRGLAIASNCQFCGEPETCDHLLFHCVFAHEIWCLAPFKDQLESHQVQTFAEALKSSFKWKVLPPIGVEACSLFPWICWAIWGARNRKFFENRTCEKFDTISKAIADAREWQEAQPEKVNMKTVLPQAPSSSDHSNLITIYTDAAWSKDLKIAGLGWMAEDRSKAGVNQGGKGETLVTSAIVAEGMAIRDALMQAR